MDGTCYLVKLSARPTRGLMDEKMTLMVHNSPPGFMLTVRSHHQCEEGNSWEAFGHYVSDASGAIDGTKLISSGEIVHSNQDISFYSNQQSHKT